MNESSSTTTAPFFQSPSVPSFRLGEDFDDLGNFVVDPKRRQHCSTDPIASSPLDRAMHMVWGFIRAFFCFLFDKFFGIVLLILSC